MVTEGVAVRLARLSPRGWWGTMHTYLLEIGFVSSTADPCVYNLDYGAVLLSSLCGRHFAFRIRRRQSFAGYREAEGQDGDGGPGTRKVPSRYGHTPSVHAGTIILPHETYARAILETYGMADARPAKTPAEAGPVQIEEDENLSVSYTHLTLPTKA